MAKDRKRRRLGNYCRGEVVPDPLMVSYLDKARGSQRIQCTLPTTFYILYTYDIKFTSTLKNIESTAIPTSFSAGFGIMK